MTPEGIVVRRGRGGDATGSRDAARPGEARSGGRAWRDQRGQTTVEWLMIAGLLTVMYISIGSVVTERIQQYGKVLIHAVKGIGP